MGRTTRPPVNPGRQAWDSRIMRQRSRLEDYWRNTLTDDERTAWSGYMDITPPTDASQHSYVTFTPNRLNQVLVTRQTQFAWQWIYAVNYFAASPTRTPLSATDPDIQITDYDDDSHQLATQLSCNIDASDLWGVLWYATPNMTPYNGNPYTACRVFARWQPDVFPRWLDVTAPYLDTWGSRGQNSFSLGAYGVGLHGNLCASRGMQLVGWSE